MFALPISKPRFKSIIFYQNSRKIRLFLQKMHNFRALGTLPPNPSLRQLGAWPPDPHTAPSPPPHCQFLATRLSICVQREFSHNTGYHKAVS